MFKSQGFNELSEDALSFILLSDRLKMDEEDILGKVTEWATVNSVCKRAERGEVLTAIDVLQASGCTYNTHLHSR